MLIAFARSLDGGSAGTSSSASLVIASTSSGVSITSATDARVSRTVARVAAGRRRRPARASWDSVSAIARCTRPAAIAASAARRESSTRSTSGASSAPRRRVAEQLQRRLEVLARLVRAAHAHRLVAGLDAGPHGRRQVVRRARVPGQLGRRPRDVAGGQRRGVPGVQRHPLAGQQVVVDRLGEQGVPERVAVAAGRHQHVGVHRRAQRRIQHRLVQPRDPDEQRVRHPAPGDRRRPHDGPGVVVQPVEPDQQQLCQVPRQRAATALDAGHQLLDEERVALGPAQDAAHLVARAAARGAGRGPARAPPGRRAARAPAAAPTAAAPTGPRSRATGAAGAGRRCGRRRRPRPAARAGGRTGTRGSRGSTGRPSARPRPAPAAAACSASMPSAPCTASNSAERSIRSPASSPSSRRPGISRATAGKASSTCWASAGCSAASRPNTSLNGRYGSVLSPKSRQCPTTTRQPASSAVERSSASSRVLPTPASPDSSTHDATGGSPCTSTSPTSRSSSSARPTSGAVGSDVGAVTSTSSWATPTRANTLLSVQAVRTRDDGVPFTGPQVLRPGRCGVVDRTTATQPAAEVGPDAVGVVADLGGHGLGR